MRYESLSGTRIPGMEQPADNYVVLSKVVFDMLNVYNGGDLQACRGSSRVVVTPNSG